MDNNTFHINRFGLGSDYDTDPKQLPEGKYIKGKNITLVKNGDYFSVSNIKGTEFIAEVINKAGIIDSGSINVMAVAKSKYLNKTFFPEVVHECITIFLTRRNNEGALYEIYIHNLTTGETRNIYSKQYTSGISKLMNTTVDFFVFGEKGYDAIYFVDSIHSLRKIPGVILSRNYNDRDLSTQRYYPGIDEGTGPALSGLGAFIVGDFISSIDPNNPLEPPPPIQNYQVLFTPVSTFPDSGSVYYESNMYTQIKTNPQIIGDTVIFTEIVVNAEFKPRAKECNNFIEEDLSYTALLDVTFAHHGVLLNQQKITMGYQQTNSFNNFFTDTAGIEMSHEENNPNGDDVFVIIKFRGDWNDPNFATSNCSNDGAPDFVSPGGIEGSIEIMTASIVNGSGNITYGLKTIPFNITIPTV